MSDSVVSSTGSTNSTTNVGNSGDNGANAQNNTNVNSNVDNQNTNNSQQTNEGQQNTDGLDGLFDASQQNDNGQQNVNVPESYQFVDADGNDLGLDAETQKGFSDAFKDLGLSQEQATKAMGLYMGDIKQLAETMVSEQEAQQKQQIAEWRKAVANDPELGGQNLAQTKQNIANVMNKFGNDELKAYLNSGAGYNPVIIKLLNAVGSQLGNDSQFINGKGGNGGTEESSYERAKRLYPNSPSLWR